ncbi:MAG: negative regulator of septation ring formation, partial [Rhizobiales bacterium]|nr:negative regulator of septation ring formation [Hyphomicrobiales bacterium]
VETIQSGALAAQNSLVAAANEAGQKAKATAAEIEQSVIGASNSFQAVLSGKSDEIVGYMTQQTDRLSETLDSKRGSLVETIGGKSNQLIVDIERVTSEALKAIESRGLNFSQSIATNGSTVARSITAAGELATGAVNKSLKDLEQASRASIEQSRQVSMAAVTEMQETSKVLRTDTVALFERLREGNILLQEVLTGAHDNLNSLERAMVSRVAEFVAAITDVSTRSGNATQSLEDQLTMFHAKTSKAIEGLSGLSTQFEDHGRALVEAVTAMEQSNRNTDSSIADRKAALDQLVGTIDARTLDLDQRLSRFTTLLDESLAAAEERARDIARVVADTAGTGSATITRQFEAVRTAAEEQRQATADTLHALYEKSTQETETIFRQSADKFASMVQGMKQMASEMHQELEMTREELRRGVFELPQEAAENTAQMRKVIVDQIEALAELNRIVARHGRGADVVGTERATAHRREEPQMAAVGGGYAEVPARPAPRRQTSSAATLPPPDIGTPMPHRTEAPPVSPSIGESNDDRDGWLSDLLSRADTIADEHDAPRSRQSQPASQGNPLETLSLDIGHLMDRNLAAEMWDRYQRGENKAFSKRLYTPSGQKTFDEVARKYRSDRNFKQTVDRYITEFERLLDDVARDERGPAMLRSHLISETGLVYTMLAHASGRLN